MKKYLILTLAIFCCGCAKQKEKESWLYVVHARDAQISPTELVLNNPDGQGNCMKKLLDVQQA